MEIQKTYSNMDFMVADYESDEEAASYLSRSTKEYSEEGHLAVLADGDSHADNLILVVTQLIFYIIKAGGSF